MRAIDAIATRYRGADCRSRLEARWLVWLDALAIPWEYEPQAFSLSDRGYLPDLWLPVQETWVEIKPPHTPLDRRLAAAVQEESGSPLLWISGEPRLGGYSVSLCDFGGVEVVEGLQFALSRGGSLWLADEAEECCLPLPPRWMRLSDDFPLGDHERLLAAYTKAMTWKF
jgi:hypothetical protein